MKRIIALLVLGTLILSFGMAQDLSGFARDFEALIVSITRSIAPSLQLNSLAADVVGTASINKFVFVLPSIGISGTNGIAPIMKPGAHEWSLVSFPELIEKTLADEEMALDIMNMVETRFMPYPAIKGGVGFALPKDFDCIITGMAFPDSLTTELVDLAGEPLSDLGISFNLYNLGIEGRKTLIKDSRKTPALSVGLLYNVNSFDMGIKDFELKKLMDGEIDIPGDKKLNMKGKIAFSTLVHNFGATIHLSKKLLFFTPYIKVAGIWQQATTKSTVDLKAYTDESSTSIKIKPVIEVGDYATLITTGFDLNLFALVFNLNLIIDVARFDLQIGDFSKLQGNGFALNTGMRIEF